MKFSLTIILTIILSLVLLNGCTNDKSNLTLYENHTHTTETEKVNKQVYENNIDSISRKSNIILDTNADNIMSTINQLCVSPRPVTSQGEQRACSLLQDRLEDYGYSTKVQQFPFIRKKKYSVAFERYFDIDLCTKPDGYGHNLIAFNTYDENKRTLIISAHYDTNSNTIGAIDNASGTAVLLEIARKLQDYELPFNIRFIFFSGEEAYLYGSRYYVSKLTDEEREEIFACFNIDMVGAKDAGDLIITTPLGLPNVIECVINNTTNTEPIKSIYPFGTSDHQSFTVAQIPSIHFYQPDHDHDLLFNKKQLDYLDRKLLASTTDRISAIVINYDLNLHEKYIKESYVKNIDVNSIQPTVLNLNHSIEGYSLKSLSSILCIKGTTSTLKYEYVNLKGETYNITLTPSDYVKDIDLTSYTLLKPNGTDEEYESIYINTDKSSDIKLLIKIPWYYVKISGDITEQEAIKLYRESRI